MNSLINPLLEEDEETLVRPDPINPLLEDDDDEGVYASAEPTKPWSKPVRSAEDEEILERRKRAGDVPTGKKKRRNTMTAKDAMLLAFLSWGRVATADQLSMLLETSAAHGNEAGRMASPKTVLNRLLRLREIGAVEDVSLWNEQRIWGVTDFGRGAAMAYGLVGRPGQVQRKGLKGLNYTTINHTLAVNQVAAQLLSPFGFLRNDLRLPPQLTFDMLLSEYEVNTAWLKTNARIAARNKDTNGSLKFKDWRSATLKKLAASAMKDEIAYRDLADSEPALWALGQTPVAGDEVREHHLPDLVVNLERFRRNEARGSIAIEVELVAKSVSSYRKQLTLWAADLTKVTDYPDPLLYNQLIFFTNDSLVKERLIEADKKQQTGLIESNKLLILPLTMRDGVTPINLSTRI